MNFGKRHICVRRLPAACISIKLRARSGSSASKKEGDPSTSPTDGDDGLLLPRGDDSI